MKTAPAVPIPAPLKSVPSRRSEWYLDVHSIRPKRQFTWTLTERALLYKLRVEKKMSIAEIQKYFRKKKKIPVFLGVDEDSDKFSRTRLHNQIRLIRGSFQGRCHQCRTPLKKKDLKRINKKEKKDPSLGLCSTCAAKAAEYKKTRREQALSLGICPVCMDDKLLEGHTSCKSCLSTSHRYRYLEGLCGRCGKKPLAKDSSSLCTGCLKKNREASKEYRRKKRA